MDVSIDDRNECYYVLWNLGVIHAKDNLERWGFRGVSGLEKVDVLNGNEARTAARRNAIDRGCMYGWRGNYDWGVTRDSGLYFFSYDAYVGPDGDLFDGRKQ